jgi:RNA polymerase sigma-B factor
VTAAVQTERVIDEHAERDRLTEAHLPLARHLARRYARGPDDLEELTQVASLALVKAADRFDPERGVQFSSFAAPTIIGELKRHFRDTGWDVHVPREMQERALLVERAGDGLSSRLGRSPRVRELARETGLSEEDVIEAREAARCHHVDSLEMLGSSADAGEEGSWSDRVGSEDPCYELVDEFESVAPLLSRLSDRQREVLRMRFFEGLTQAEIGRRVGVSQMQVSRILRGSLETLREWLLPRGLDRGAGRTFGSRVATLERS